MNKFSIFIITFSILTIYVVDGCANELFEPIVIDDSIPRAYQVAIADINNDGRPDITALGEGKHSFVAWYENPTWKRYPISGEETTNHIDLACHDLDADGELEVVVASSFNMRDTTGGGKISWMDRTENIQEPWTVYPIHAEPTTHRFRWADPDGSGKKKLIVAPIMGKGTSGPDFDQTPVRLLSFRIPENPRTNSWPMDVLDESLHILHGLFIDDIDRDEREEILTASLGGIHIFGLRPDSTWVKIRAAQGAPPEEGRPGSSELASGRFKEGQYFLVSIDPWHGNQVAVYTSVATQRFPMERKVIDSSYNSGHALACADFDDDGGDEIIGGYRGEGFTIYYYDFDSQSETWSRSIIDQGGVAAQGFAVGDINKDGKTDFVAAGGATNNVMLYLNRGE